jgi:hypothetical protein
MSDRRKIEGLLNNAESREKEYNWLGAIEFYEKALACVLQQKDFLKAGEILERIGFCLHKAAMQAESREEFKQGMQQAVEAYEKAQGFYENLADEQKPARIFRCRAIAKYLGYWLASNPSEKRKLLDECLELEKSALTAFWNLGNMLEYGRTYNELSLVFWHRIPLEWDRQVIKRIAEEGMQWGEKVVAVLSELEESYEIAMAYFILTTCLSILGDFVAEPEKREQQRLKVVEYFHKTLEFSERIGDTSLVGLCHLGLGFYLGGEESIRHFEKVLECGENSRDNFLKGTGLDYLAYVTYWKTVATEDPDQRRELAEEAMKFYDKSQHHYSIISFQSPRVGVIASPGGYAEYYLHRAMWETDSKERLQFLEKAEKAGMEALKLAEDSDMPEVIATTFHVVSKTLHAQAFAELVPTEKRSRLEKALKYREKTIKILGQITPFNYWDRGVMQNHLAEIKAELADTELDLNNKRRLVEEAVSSKEECLRLCNKSMPYLEKVGNSMNFAALQVYQDTYATLLTLLYDLTDNTEYLRKAIEISKGAIESASKLGMLSVIAESHWKIARTQDILGEHLEAAESFERASESFMKAAEKIPQLKEFYQDHALYMRAWNEIEKAKSHHARQEYGPSKEYYDKAAILHKSSKRWNYLSSNYLAWARLEEAEDLSRRDQTEEAIGLLQQSARLFAEAKISIKTKLEKIEVEDEKEMATRLFKASDVREEYCLGRIALEEAKILDRRGDHTASSRKYESAAEIFQTIAEAEPEQSREEIELIIYVCQAWQKMMLAEAKASPIMYREAAELFKKANEHAIDKQTGLLALANSSFCKALEIGTRFEDTRDITMYSTAKKHMEAATNYYIKAGFQSGSEYARATQRLLDAYMNTARAETETEPMKKAQYYQMAEKLLRSSSGLYTKSKYPAKGEEVRKLLESVREERQLAISLTKVLHASTIASTTTSFFTPTPTHEKAVGLERFEHANVQAYLKAPEEVTIEEELEVRLDLVNVAKNFGLLVRVDDLVPPSLKVAVSPSQYNIENSSLDMKGKRLEPLKVESIKLCLQATEAGVINLNPQVIYVDDVGKFRTCRPEPINMIVHPKLTFEFKTKDAQSIFDFLISSFVEDYMRRMLSLQEAGWRSLMQIVRKAGVSRRRVYGAKGRVGPAISELKGRGLIETRFFTGERGRGGKILKTRISYEKETIKRYVDQRVVKIG